MNAALIVAAGSASRMGFDKLLAPLAGEPVILHTLRAFQNCADIDGIWVVSGGERSARILEMGADIAKFRGVVTGGAARHLSVWNGLEALPAEVDVVAVHDGARPLIAPEQIRRCLHAAAECGAAASARRVTETLKRADSEGRVTGSIAREDAWIMETPQVFRLALLRAAYAEVLARGATVTDEVSALELTGHSVRLVENFSPNPKITLPGDMELAERVLGVRLAD